MYSLFWGHSRCKFDRLWTKRVLFGYLPNDFFDFVVVSLKAGLYLSLRSASSWCRVASPVMYWCKRVHSLTFRTAPPADTTEPFVTNVGWLLLLVWRKHQIENVSMICIFFVRELRSSKSRTLTHSIIRGQNFPTKVCLTFTRRRIPTDSVLLMASNFLSLENRSLFFSKSSSDRLFLSNHPIDNYICKVTCSSTLFL